VMLLFTDTFRFIFGEGYAITYCVATQCALAE